MHGAYRALDDLDVETLQRVLRENPILATQQNDYGVLLLSHSICVHARTQMFARKKYTIIKTLVNAGVDVNATRKDDQLFEHLQPISLAAWYGDAQIVQLLIDAGADVNSRTTSNYTALHAAASEEHVKIVRTLLAAGADVNYRKLCAPSSITDHISNLAYYPKPKKRAKIKALISVATNTQPLLVLCTFFICDHIRDLTGERLQLLPVELRERIRDGLVKRSWAFPEYLAKLSLP